MHQKFALMIAALLLTVGATHASPRQQDNPHQWWNERVFYEVFVRSFNDSDGDGIGDLQGLIDKLDYLNDGDPSTTDDLGVTGLWLMPVAEAPSYHGYDATDYRQIEQDYGTNEDFRELMAAAHERGIVVIVDLVLNHTSNQHEWFTASAAGDPEYADWYIWQDNVPRGQQGWHLLNGRYYYGAFSETQPELNLANPDVTAELYDVARFWLQDMGVDGFRLDAIKHLIEENGAGENSDETHAWLQGFHAYVESVNPDALTVGEAWTSSYYADDYVGGEVDIVFEFELASAMVASVQQGSRETISAIAERTARLYPPGQYATFLTNHDQNRVNSELDGYIEASKLAAALLLTSPGVPFIYYGEEIGMTGMRGAGTDAAVRTPMQWDDTPNTAGFTTGTAWQPITDGYRLRNVAVESTDPDSLLSYYRQLIRLRNEHPALRHGDYLPVESSTRDVYAFVRHSDEETILVMMNMTEAPVSDYMLTLEAGPLTDSHQPQLVFGAGADVIPLGANDAGGFDEYRPLDTLPPQSMVGIQLADIN
ncbi:MAG: DUF3459 domain-containing protein [Burkholderiales bacterium]|nr:DUF3459 domain-containing protein [Anaerolineae bacterium]